MPRLLSDRGGSGGLSPTVQLALVDRKCRVKVSGMEYTKGSCRSTRHRTSGAKKLKW